ncbi:hypothetical protein EDD18DRAFT_1171357 [Armillaria luteobubalina]|uniref:Uncharacterized protein n=1 Tax=Armillaria luteobubalina TaxID=153913 RepID=A0AA39Q2V2_9AGAR|nr:hypothetical protein EDD18DRAFT_1171357 [Armillaria luteobubalina]
MPHRKRICELVILLLVHGPHSIPTMTSNFIYFWILLVWEPMSLGKEHPMYIKAREFNRVKHCNGEPYTYTCQRPIMYDGCVDIGVGKEPSRPECEEA